MFGKARIKGIEEGNEANVSEVEKERRPTRT